MTYLEKIHALRKMMIGQEVQGFLVPRTDEYQGEYVPECYERLKWLTGFTGSAGIAVILIDKAVVMSDGRYTLQLENQLDLSIYETANSQNVKLSTWIKKNAKKDIVIGYDPKLHTSAQIEELENEKIELKMLTPNLIDEIWKDRPSLPASNVEIFSESIAGKSASKKIKEIVGVIEGKGADALVLTLSDSIAWLLNIRGFDIPHIPVALSYAIIFADGSLHWYIDKVRLSSEVIRDLPENTHIMPPQQLDINSQKFSGVKILLDDKRSSVWFDRVLRYAGAEIIHAKDPCIDVRARKTNAEQIAMKNAHIRDGVAMVKFLKWFEDNYNKENLTELSVEEKLNNFRSQADEFRDTSFDTIAGYGSNGAIVHYRATEESSQIIKKDNLLLLDSGAQYIDGTTDITRTLAVGNPTPEMIERNTYVLKSHIALASAVFKKGTLGKDLDAICRKPMQDKGLDYGHGTGHGVGCYLSVHEEAASISPRGEQALEAGMVISNEPGYYKEGAYGIRIENLVLVKENDSGDLFFETITVVPLDKKLIDASLLTNEERQWVNNYHARVYETLTPLLDNDHKVWLKHATAAI